MGKFKKVIAKVISVITAASISLQIAASAGAEAGIDFQTDDFEVTERMQSAAELLGVHLLDHIIAGKRGTYYSFHEAGVLEREIVKEEKKTAERTR